MNQNQKPHSRDKKVGSGSASAGKGNQVNTGGSVGGSSRPQNQRPSGSRPSSGRTGFAPTGGASGGGNVMRGGSGLDLKKILIIAVIAIILIFVFKNCGGGLPSLPIDPFTPGEQTDTENYNNYSDYAYGKLDRSVSPLARAKYVTPVGNGKDTVTIMIYMCGTDLESKYGMATKDIVEMTNAALSDKVNIIIETGGCSKWQNNTISNKKNQIYKVEQGGLRLIEDDMGTSAMTDSKNLTKFIDYCEKEFPADRNMLIFWDHGGGSVSGYGYDEKNPNASSMTLAGIASALKGANCKFDFIGFDACLMATFETALVCDDYADYLLASEETEPGTGWYYTRWLTELSKNTSIPTLDLAKIIIDDFVTSSTNSSGNAQVTLSLTDLSELHGTAPDAFRDFASSTCDMIRGESEEFAQVSDARRGVRQFAQSSRINQVDLGDLADRIGTDDAKELSDVIRSAVKYNRSSVSRCSGLSIYFPYEDTKSVKSAVSSYTALGMDSEYTDCIKAFASLEVGGQAVAASTQYSSGSGSADVFGSLLSTLAGGGSSTSPVESLLGTFLGGSGSASAGSALDVTSLLSMLGGVSGRSLPAEYDWLDTDLISGKAEQLIGMEIDPSHITVTEKGGKNVLSLTSDEWNLVKTVELNVFVRDGEGYIDLGRDNTFEFDGDDLLLDWDGTWLCVNGNVCAYYLLSDTEEEDGSYTTVGYIPALLNGEYVKLQVLFNKANPYGMIVGAFPGYENGETETEAKGMVKILAGDKLQMLCDYYTLDGDYSASYELGDAFTVPKTGLSLENLELTNDEFSVSYRLTDIYGNNFWTPAIAG